MRSLILALFFLLPHVSFAGEPHVHGLIQLDIAVEQDKMLVILKCPAESLIGFEYRPKTDEEKKIVQKVKTMWKKSFLL